MVVPMSLSDRFLAFIDRLVAYWLRRPPRERKIPGSNPVCDGILPGFSHTRDLKISTPVATCQAPGVIGSVPELVGPVSVYCDWVRWKVWSATSISVWQHVKLSEQIRPWDTLACCWEVKQPTKKQTLPLYDRSLAFPWPFPHLCINICASIYVL